MAAFFPEPKCRPFYFLLALLTFLVYSLVARHQFLNFDDDR